MFGSAGSMSLAYLSFREKIFNPVLWTMLTNFSREIDVSRYLGPISCTHFHGNASHRTLYGAEGAPDTGLLFLQVWILVRILHLCRICKTQAVHRAGINTDRAGHAQLPFYPGLGPLGTFHHSAGSPNLVEHSILGTYPSACPAFYAH
jgi:hypothetical protein